MYRDSTVRVALVIMGFIVVVALVFRQDGVHFKSGYGPEVTIQDSSLKGKY